MLKMLFTLVILNSLHLNTNKNLIVSTDKLSNKKIWIAAALMMVKLH